MSGARRIRAACFCWYLLCLGVSFPAAYVAMGGMPEHPDPNVIDISAEVLWAWVAAFGSLPFVFLIHLLAAIWDTLIGMALQSEARTAPRPQSDPGPQA